MNIYEYIFIFRATGDLKYLIEIWMPDMDTELLPCINIYHCYKHNI